MKRMLVVFITIAVVFLAIYIFSARAADNNAFQTYEFATIRWDGRDNTHLIRPNGRVEPLGQILKRTSRPDRTDERTFYMNVAMNAVAKEGFEFAGMTADEIVMRRLVPR